MLSPTEREPRKATNTASIAKQALRLVDFNEKSPRSKTESKPKDNAKHKPKQLHEEKRRSVRSVKLKSTDERVDGLDET